MGMHTKLSPGDSIDLVIVGDVKPGDTIRVEFGRDRGGKRRDTTIDAPKAVAIEIERQNNLTQKK